MINVSLCKKKDYDTLIEIEKFFFQNPISRSELESYENQDSHVIWKIEEKKIIGFISFFHVKDEIEIIKICIIKSYQRKRFGSMLIDEIKKLNIKKIFLEVSNQNKKAINFYLKNGFQKIGVRKGYYSNTNDSPIDALRLCFEI